MCPELDHKARWDPQCAESHLKVLSDGPCGVLREQKAGLQREERKVGVEFDKPGSDFWNTIAEHEQKHYF
jgi:hypothetical protein